MIQTEKEAERKDDERGEGTKYTDTQNNNCVGVYTFCSQRDPCLGVTLLHLSLLSSFTASDSIIDNRHSHLIYSNQPRRHKTKD